MRSLSEGLRAFARLINEQVECPDQASSVNSDESVPTIDHEEFWDTYGANLVRFYNYFKYGYWRPEDGLDVYVPGLVDASGRPAARVRSRKVYEVEASIALIPALWFLVSCGVRR